MYNPGGFGQTQYGQQAQPQFSQQTGFGQQPLQTQFTGYPGISQAQQQQYPGIGGQQNASAVPSLPSLPSYQQQPPQPLPQPPQQAPAQQPYSIQPPPQPQRPQPTGMTSAQMADSFRGSAASTAATQRSRRTPSTSKIPNIRLSFITAPDQAKFEQLFKSAVGTSQAMSGDQARDLLMRSKLSGDDLAHVW